MRRRRATDTFRRTSPGDPLCSAVSAVVFLLRRRYARGMDLERWRQGGRTFSHRGHDVFSRDEGAGPVLLCIHGFPSASWDWH